MFQDEARFGRISDPKACWARKPVRPTVGAQLVREYVYVFGAVSPEDGQHDSLVLPVANTEAMSVFLEELSRRHPDEDLLIFMDQAGWHKAKALKIPENIELVFLPPYCPDLNPQEQMALRCFKWVRWMRICIFSRPNEFIAAISLPEKGGNIKGAKRRGQTREPLILQASPVFFSAAMKKWTDENLPFE